MMTISTPDVRANFGLHAMPFTRELPINSRFKHLNTTGSSVHWFRRSVAA